jgi:hypothetical protein
VGEGVRWGKGLVIRAGIERTGKERQMTTTLDPLILDLVEWCSRERRPYAEVIEAWRTSCPRLTVWEDAVDRGYLSSEAVQGQGVLVAVTPLGRSFLQENGRLSPGQ